MRVDEAQAFALSVGQLIEHACGHSCSLSRKLNGSNTLNDGQGVRFSTSLRGFGPDVIELASSKPPVNGCSSNARTQASASAMRRRVFSTP